MKSTQQLFGEDKHLNSEESYQEGLRLQKECKYQEAIEFYNIALASTDKKYANQEMIDCYDQAIKAIPNSIDLYISKANLLSVLDKKDEELQCLEIVQGIHDRCKAIYNEAIELFYTSKHEEALKCFDEIIQINPNHKEAYYTKGAVLYNLGRYEDSDICYNTAIVLDHKAQNASKGKEVATDANAIGNTVALKIGDHKYGDAYIGNVLYHLGKYNSAIKSYDNVLKTDPDHIGSLYYKANAYKNLGLQEQNSKKANVFYKKAIEYFDKVINIDTKHANAYYNKANVLNYAGKDEEAINCYDIVLKLDPKFTSAYNNKGIILKDLCRYKEALECYDKALKIDENNVLYLCNRALIHQDLGKKELAFDDLKLASAIANQNKIQGVFQAHSKYIKDILGNLVALEEGVNHMKQETKKLNQDNNQVQVFMNKVDDFEHKNDLLNQDMLTSINNQDHKTDYQELKALYEIQRKEFQKLQEILGLMQHSQVQQSIRIEALETSLNEVGIGEEIKVKLGFKELYDTDLKLHEYGKVFYWTLINYFNAYRNLSTGLQQGNVDFESTTKEKLLSKAAKVGAKSIEKVVGHFLPMIGGIIAVIDTVIEEIYGAYKHKRFEDKVNAINKVIMFNADPSLVLEKDMSLNIAKSALEITNNKHDAILNPAAVQKTKLMQIKEWCAQKIKVIKAKAFGDGIELYESEQATMALTDVTLLLAYMYKNWQIIISKQELLSNQIVSIVLSGSADKLLEENLQINISMPNSSGNAIDSQEQQEQLQNKQDVIDKTVQQQPNLQPSLQNTQSKNNQHDTGRIDASQNQIVVGHQEISSIKKPGQSGKNIVLAPKVHDTQEGRPHSNSNTIKLKNKVGNTSEKNKSSCCFVIDLKYDDVVLDHIVKAPVAIQNILFTLLNQDNGLDDLHKHHIAGHDVYYQEH